MACVTLLDTAERITGSGTLTDASRDLGGMRISTVLSNANGSGVLPDYILLNIPDYTLTQCLNSLCATDPLYSALGVTVTVPLLFRTRVRPVTPAEEPP